MYFASFFSQRAKLELDYLKIRFINSSIILRSDRSTMVFIVRVLTMSWNIQVLHWGSATGGVVGCCLASGLEIVRRLADSQLP